MATEYTNDHYYPSSDHEGYPMLLRSPQLNGETGSDPENSDSNRTWSGEEHGPDRMKRNSENGPVDPFQPRSSFFSLSRQVPVIASPESTMWRLPQSSIFQDILQNEARLPNSVRRRRSQHYYYDDESESEEYENNGQMGDHDINLNIYICFNNVVYMALQPEDMTEDETIEFERLRDDFVKAGGTCGSLIFAPF